MTGDRVADPGTILAAHRFHGEGDNGIVRCACGWVADTTISSVNGNTLHAAHQLAMLADAGIAVLALPEPDMSDEKFGQVWRNDPVVGTVQACLDGTCELRGDYEYTHQPAELREAAAVLLAAASAAEKGTVR